VEKLQELGSANGILVLEDIDRFLQQNPDALAPFLELFDWGNKSFYNQYFGINFNIEGLIIVLTGNTPLSDMALADRLWLIKMPQYEYEHKVKIVWNYIVPSLLLNNPQRQRIQRLLPAHKAQIEEYLKLDKNPGFRTVEKLLTRYFNYLERLSLSPNTSSADLKTFIMASNEELERQERAASKG
jgi:ATP-dependent Lon protease